MINKKKKMKTRKMLKKREKEVTKIEGMRIKIEKEYNDD